MQIACFGGDAAHSIAYRGRSARGPNWSLEATLLRSRHGQLYRSSSKRLQKAPLQQPNHRQQSAGSNVKEMMSLRDCRLRTPKVKRLAIRST